MPPDSVLLVLAYGNYIAWWKLLPFLLVFMVWLRLLTWIDKDAPAIQLPRQAINLSMLGGLLAAVILFFLMPTYVAAIGLFLAVFIGEIVTYLVIRHQKAGLDDLTKSIASAFKSKARKEKEVQARRGEVVIMARGKPIPVPPDDAPERVGFDAAQDMLTFPLRRGAERIDLVPVGDGTSQVLFYVDGFPYVSRTFNRTEATAIADLMKSAAGLDINDRRKPQSGTLKFVHESGKSEVSLSTAGSSAGEQLVMDLNVADRYRMTLPDLGFTDEQEKSIEQSLRRASGIVLVAAPKGQGLTTLLHALVRGHDAFVLNIQAVERNAPIEMEGVTLHRLPASASPADELKQINWLVSTEPDVLMVDRLDNPQSAHELIRLAAAGKRIYLGIRAGGVFEALNVWRKLVGNDQQAVSHLDMIISGRVMRRLCNACKQAYVPDPEALRKLNLNPEKVHELFQARTTPLRDQRGNEVPCTFCGDTRYKGRFGVYENFEINDEVRAGFNSGITPDAFKGLFRKQKRRFIQEVALIRVQIGDTSIQEMLRVLRNEAPQPAAAPQLLRT